MFYEVSNIFRAQAPKVWSRGRPICDFSGPIPIITDTDNRYMSGVN